MCGEDEEPRQRSEASVVGKEWDEVGEVGRKKPEA